MFVLLFQRTVVVLLITFIDFCGDDIDGNLFIYFILFKQKNFKKYFKIFTPEDTLRPGTTKRRQYYYKRIAPCLIRYRYLYILF